MIVSPRLCIHDFHSRIYSAILFSLFFGKEYVSCISPVDKSYWHKALIFGSNSIIGADANITVILSCSVDIAGGTEFTLKGLQNSPTRDASSLPISGKSAVIFDSRSGVWSKETGVLKLTSSLTVPAFCELQFFFVLTNPLAPSPGSFVQILVANPYTFGNMSGTVLAALSNPTWTQHPRVTESSNVRNTPNILTFNLGLNVPVRGGSTMTISGLTGAHSPAICNEYYICVYGKSSEIFSGFGEWESGGTLKLTVSDSLIIQPEAEIEFQIQIVNPDIWPFSTCGAVHGSCLEPALGPSTDESLYIYAFIFLSADMIPVNISNSVQGKILNCSTNYAFTTRRISENNSFTKARNLLYFFLVPNFFLPEDSTIIVQGLINTGYNCYACNVTVNGESAPKFRTAGTIFDAIAGTLKLNVGRSIFVGENVSFAVSILNGNPAEAVTPWISTLGTLGSFSGVAMPMQGSVLGAALLPTFQTASLQETSTIKSAPNLLTVYFNPAFELFPSCQLTVSGLRGSLTDSGFIGIDGSIQVFDTNTGILADEKFWQDGYWNESTGMLIIDVATYLPSIAPKTWKRCPQTCLYHFSFELLNPVEQPAFEEIYLVAGLGWMGVDSVPFLLKLPGVSNKPTFLVAVVQESSSMPGALNRICVNMSVSGSILPGSILTISGVHGTTTASTDYLPIADSNPGEFQSPADQYNCTNGDKSSQTRSQQTASYALFDAAAGNISVVCCRRIVLGPISFCFDLNNSLKATQPSLPMVSCSGVVSYYLSTMEVSGASPNPRGILSSDFTPEFIVRNVSESSSVCGSNNSIQFHIRPNFDLRVGQLIVIDGLLGSQTKSSQNISVFGAARFLFGSVATWNQDVGTLILTVRGIGHSNATYTFSIVLKNPLNLSANRQLSISASNIFYVSPQPLYGQVLGSQIFAIFSNITVSESNNIPAAPNIISISLEASVEMKVGAAFYISGLIDSAGVSYNPLISNGSMKIKVLWSRPYFSLQNWAEWDGSKLYFFIAQSLQPLCRLSFGFGLVNPLIRSEAAKLTATYVDDFIIGPVIISDSILAANGTVFINFSATESNQIKSEENEINFVFSTNTIFPRGQVFYIYPFHGITLNQDQILLYGSSAACFRPCIHDNNAATGYASWNFSAEQICLVLDCDSSRWETFELTIRLNNPAHTQDPVVLSLRGMRPLITNAFASLLPGVLASSESCRLKNLSLYADITPTLIEFLFTVSSNCRISSPLALNIIGLSEFCTREVYVSANRSLFLGEYVLGLIELKILNVWEPNTVEFISVWCSTFTSTPNISNISVQVHTNTLQNEGICSAIIPCILSSEVAIMVSVSPVIWIDANVSFNELTILDRNITLNVFLKPAIDLPANTTLTVQGFKGNNSLPGQNVSSSDWFWLSTFSPFNVSKSCSYSATFPFVSWDGTTEFFFLLSFSLHKSNMSKSISSTVFQQQMACFSSSQIASSNICHVVQTIEASMISLCTLNAYTSYDSFYAIFISLVPAVTIPAQTYLIFSGFKGLFLSDQILNVTSLFMESNMKALFSSLHGTIKIFVSQDLLANENVQLQILLYPPLYCNQEPITAMTLLLDHIGSVSQEINVAGVFYRCSPRPKFLRAIVKQRSSINPDVNIANFLSFDFSIDSTLAEGERFFLSGACASDDDTSKSKWVVRLFGLDSRLFWDIGTWTASNCTIEFRSRQVLNRFFAYSLNIEIMYPLNSTLMISSTSIVDPVLVDLTLLLDNDIHLDGLAFSNCLESTRVQGALNNISCTVFPKFSWVGKTTLFFGGFAPNSYTTLQTDTITIPVYYDFGQGLKSDVGSWIVGKGLLYQTCDNCIISSEIGALIVFGVKNSYTANKGTIDIYLTMNNTFFNTRPFRLGIQGNNTILTSNIPAQFSVGEVYESNSVTSSLNMITIIFQPNAELLSGTFISISGLTGTQTETTYSLSVYGPQSEAFGASGQWDACAGQLILRIQDNYTISSTFQSTLSFWIQNNANVQSSPAVSIASSGSDPNRHFQVPTTVLQGLVLGASTAPAFTTLISLDENTIQSEMNNLTFCIRTNFILAEFAVLTVSGLVGSSTVSTSRLLVTGTGASLFQNGSGLSFAEWNQTDGSIRLTVARGILIGEGCTTTFSLQVRNPDACRTPINPTFSIAQSLIQIGPVQGFGSVFSSCTKAEFTFLQISEDSAVKGSMNRITVSFRQNIRLLSNSNITLSGLIGSLTQSTTVSYLTDCKVAWELETCSITYDQSAAQWGRIITENSMVLMGPDASKFSIECAYNAFEFAVPEPVCVWNSTAFGIFSACGGILLLRLNSNLDSSEVTSFSFMMLNPVISSGPVTPAISAYPLPVSVFATQLFSVTESPAWLEAAIYGSSTIMNDQNGMIVFLESNFFLPENQVVSIWGLKQSSTPSGRIKIISDFMLSEADWESDSGILSITLARAVSSFQKITFSFSLRNPNFLQFNNTPYISTSPTPKMSPQSFLTFKDILITTGSFNWINCSVKSSSSVAGAENILSIYVQPCTELSIGSSVSFSGFETLLLGSEEVILSENDTVLSSLNVDRCQGVVDFNITIPVSSTKTTRWRLIFTNPSKTFGTFSLSIELQDNYLTSFPTSCDGSIHVVPIDAVFLVCFGNQTSSVIGATNQINIEIKPSEKLVSGSMIIIYGLNSSPSSRSYTRFVTISGPESKVFNYVGRWNNKDGSLVLTIAKDEFIANDHTTSFSVHVLNPQFPLLGLHASMRAVAPTGLKISERLIEGPLLLQTDILPAWTNLEIYEETRVQMAQNTLTIEMQTNRMLTAGSYITLSGFDGINVSNSAGIVSLAGEDASCWSEKTATWQECSGLIVLRPEENCSIDSRTIRFQFLVTNGPVAVHEKNIFVEESSSHFGRSMFESKQLLTSDAKPAWVQKQLLMSCSLPGALNMINITFQANFRILKGSFVFISGLNGTSLVKANVSLYGPASSMFNILGWNTDEGILTVFAASSQEILEPISFSFALINAVGKSVNGCDGTSCRDGSVYLSLRYESAISFGERFETAVLPTWNFPATVYGRINGTSTVFGDMNRISLFVAPNFDILPGTAIILEGLDRFQFPACNVLLIGPSATFMSNSSALWQQGEGSLTFVVDKIISSSNHIELEFTLQNKWMVGARLGRRSVTIAIYGHTLTVGPTVLEGTIGVKNDSVVPAFVTRILLEQQRVPCSLNQMTLNLIANFPLMLGQHIVINGLTGSETNDMILDLGGSSADFFNFSAKWYRQEGMLILVASKRIEAFTFIEIRFSIRNPQTTQLGRTPTVKADLAEQNPLLDSNGSPCAVLSAFEGPHVLFKAVIVGQTLESMDLSRKEIFIGSTSALLGLNLADVFIYAVNSYNSSLRRNVVQPAIVVTTLVLCAVESFASLINTIKNKLPTKAMTNALESRGIYPLFDLFLLDEPVSYIQSIFSVQAEEYTNIQGSLNSITLKIHLEVIISIGAIIYIFSIPPNLTPSDAIALLGNGAAYFSSSKLTINNGTGLWYETGQTITLHVVKTIPASDLEIIFALRNSRQGQNYPPMQIFVIDTPTVYGPVSPSSAVLNAQNGTFFLQCDIIEGSRSAGHQNPFAMQLRANGPLPKGTILVVSGLDGSETPSDPFLPIYGGESSLFANRSTWIQENGTLILTVSGGSVIPCGSPVCHNDIGIIANQLIQLDFILLNPIFVQQPQSIFISAWSPYFSVPKQKMDSVSCSFAWCGAKFLSEYLMLENTTCYGTFCYPSGLLKIDTVPPVFVRQIQVVKSTNTSLNVEVFVSKVSIVNCSTASFLDPRITLSMFQYGEAAIPASVGASSTNESHTHPTVLGPKVRGIARIEGLEGNTIYRIFCFAKDLEIPANQMNISQVVLNLLCSN